MELPSLTVDQLVTELTSRNILTSRVEKAIQQAQKSHFGQVRMSGADYATQHVFPVAIDVANTIPTHMNPELAVTVALLHDTIEDDESFSSEVCLQQFGREVTQMVESLTKPAKNESGDVYKDRFNRNHRGLQKLKKAHEIAKWIKMADRYNNVLCSVLQESNATHEFYLYVTQELYIPFAEEHCPAFAPKLQRLVEKGMNRRSVKEAKLTNYFVAG